MSKTSKKQIVVGYHPIANRIGEKILNSGGNAFDAFVATTAAECVLGEGVTSLAGPLGALLYGSKSKKCYYLDAGFNTPLNIGKKDKIGARVPGAPAGLEAISKKFGKLPFHKVLEPAIQLARNGFKLNNLYADLIFFNKEKLKKSQYGKQKFFQNNKPLAKGKILKFPEVAVVLESLAKKGSKYMYEGEWAKKVVKEVQKKGGILTMKDFSQYEIKWRNPIKINYRDYKIYSTSGRTFGGLAVCLALKALENLDISSFKNHYSNDATALEILIRINNEAEKVVNNFKPKELDNNFLIQKLINKKAHEILEKVQKEIKINKSVHGNHSYQVSIIDKEGNAITGTNSIQSLPWGEGIFVEGIPLTASGIVTPFSTNSGERELSALSMHMGMKSSKVAFISGAFGSSLIPAEFQFLVNIIDYKLSAKKATTLPRFGTTAWEMKNKKYIQKGIWLDTRIKKSIINTLNKRGLKFEQEGWVDTGFGSIILVKPDGSVEGSIAPV
ncbi:gamma-glutamyltransferase [Candidatus Pacearchaeota archaeon]|nr:gamma-glutamyltransferase [Candidatus Pacearchaeota archaeon]